MDELKNAATRVTVIGTGAIGSAVTRRLLGGGREVAVWNRTGSRVAGLVAAGARPARSVPDAVSGSALTLLTLTDHAAVEQCLAQLGADLAGRTIIGMYTGTAREARLAAERVTGLGGRYLGAGSQTAPDAIGTDAGTIRYGGSRSAFEQHRATLALLSEPRFVGETPESAAVWDLALFGIWYDAQLGLLRALAAARAAGIDLTAFTRTAATQLGHVVTGAPATAAELEQAAYPPGPADLTEHLTVLRHLIELREGRPLSDGGPLSDGVPLSDSGPLRDSGPLGDSGPLSDGEPLGDSGPLGDGGLARVAARIEALIADGRGGEGLTAAAEAPTRRPG